MECSHFAFNPLMTGEDGVLSLMMPLISGSVSGWQCVGVAVCRGGSVSGWQHVAMLVLLVMTA